MFLAILSVFLLGGTFGAYAQVSDARQVPDQGRAFHSIRIVLPSNSGTSATDQLAASSHGNHVVSAHWPAHNIQSRIILGTNTSPGATTTWQTHNANQHTNRTHNSGVRAGVGVRAQFRASASRAQFTSDGSWSP